MWFWSTALRADKKGVKLYSNDLNLDCYNYYLNKNILMNRIKKSDLLTFNIDAREFIRMCINHVDVYMDGYLLKKFVDISVDTSNLK